MKDPVFDNPKIKAFALKQAFKMLEENRQKIPMILDVAREMMLDKDLLYGDLYDFVYVAGELEVTLESNMYRIDTLEEVEECSIADCFDVEVKLRIIMMRHNPVDLFFILSRGLEERVLLHYSLVDFNASLHLECFEDFLEIEKKVEEELDLLI